MCTTFEPPSDSLLFSPWPTHASVSCARTFLVNETKSAKSLPDLFGIAQSLHSPKFFSNLQTLIADEILDTPALELLNSLGDISKKVISPRSTPDSNSSFADQTQFTSGFQMAFDDFEIALQRDDEIQQMPVLLSTNFEMGIATVSPSDNPQGDDKRAVCRLIPTTTIIHVSNLRHLRVVGEEFVQQIVQRFCCDRRMAPLSLLVDGLDIVRQVDLIFNQRSVQTVSQQEIKNILNRLTDLSFARFGLSHAETTPTIDILAEIHYEWKDNLLHLAEFGPIHVRRAIILHFCEYLATVDSNDALFRPRLAEIWMKILLFGIDVGDANSLATLAFLQNSNDAWYIIRNLADVRRRHYFEQIFERERKGCDLNWTNWFISTFARWVTEDEGRDELFLPAAEEYCVWEHLCNTMGDEMTRFRMISQLLEIALCHDGSYSLPCEYVEDISEYIEKCAKSSCDSATHFAAVSCLVILVQVDASTDRDEYYDLVETSERVLCDVIEKFPFSEDIEVGLDLIDAFDDDVVYELYDYSKEQFRGMFRDIRCSLANDDSEW